MSSTEEPDVTRPSASKCAHQRGHIVDSRFLGHGYATEDSRRIFCDYCRLQRWLDVEAALALVESEFGIVPQSAARGIAEAARVENLDIETVRRETLRTGHSLVGLLRAFQATCAGDSGQYIHYGATTQDIQDTAQSLEMRDVLAVLERKLCTLIGCLADLAETHAGTPALGRTHAQPALPIGFGLKIAGWIDEVGRHLERIRAMRPRVLVAQLFGGVGTMAAFGADGPRLLACFAARLGLNAPTTAWHAARDRVVEYVATLAMVAATMGRIADEVRILSRPEFGEVEETWLPGAVGSSTMPHKRNPEACEQTVVMARLAAAQVGIALTAMGSDHERDARALRVEWACVPDVSHFCLAACEMTGEIGMRLVVHSDRLSANLHAVSDQIATENLMLVLSAHLGKQTAHQRVYELSQAARTQDRPVRKLVREDPEIGALLTEDELDRIFDPGEYLGASIELTRRVVAESRRRLGPLGPDADGR